MAQFQNLFNESNLSINLIIAVDNITIDYTNDGKLEVKDGGISTVKLANLAVTNSKINDMDASKLTGTITIPIDNLYVETDKLLVAAGTYLNPSITFQSDQDTGLFQETADSISFTVGGDYKMRIGPTNVTIYSGALELYGNLTMAGDFYLNSGDFHLGNACIMRIDWSGPVTSPTLTFGSADNGFYYSGTNTVSFASNSVETLRMLHNLVECFTHFKALTLSATGTISGDSIICDTLQSVSNVTVGGNLIIPAGSSAAPSLHFASDSTTGIYRNAAVTLSITSNATETARFNYSQIQFFAPLAVSNQINCTYLYSSGNVLATDGSSVNPTFSFNTNSDTGMYLDAVNTIGFSTMGNKAMSLSFFDIQMFRSLSTNGNSITCGAIDSGTNSLTCGAITCGNINAGGNSIACGSGFVNGVLTVGKASPAISTGLNRLQLYGPTTSTTGPHLQAFVNTDTYPTFQLLNWEHDNVSLGFDCYWDAAGWKSSDVGSNFQIYKISDVFSINYNSGVSPGSTTTGLLTNKAIAINTSGQVSLGRNIINTGAQKLMIYGTNNSASGPHIQTFTSADNYPLLQVASFAHNDVSLNFDCYHDGTTYRSSNTGSNFVLGKFANSFQVLFASGTSPGSIPTMNVASTWNSSGDFTCNYHMYGTELSLTDQPCLMMSASSYISVSDTTITKFTGFDTQDYSTGAIGHVSGVFTIPATGTYLITYEMTFDAAGSTSGIFNQMWVSKNGSGRFGQTKQQVTGDAMFITSSCQMRLITNDIIELYVYQNTTSNLHVGTLHNGVARIQLTKLF